MPVPVQALERMMADMKDPEFQSILDETLKEMTAAAVGSGELPGSTMGACMRAGWRGRAVQRRRQRLPGMCTLRAGLSTADACLLAALPSCL